MSNFCKHCGVKLEGSPSVCPSCNQSLNLTSELLSKRSLDELKQGLISASSKAVSMAKNVSADLVSETKKINEARKEATEASDFKSAEDKKAAVKNGVLIFWAKLTLKQKLMVACAPFFLILFIFLGGSVTNSLAKPDLLSLAKERFERVTVDHQFRDLRSVDVKLKSGGYIYVLCGQVNLRNTEWKLFEITFDTEAKPPSEKVFLSYPASKFGSVAKCLG